MGNCVGTLSWKETTDERDRVIVRHLEQLAQEQGLSTETLFAHYETGYSHVAVELSGVSIPWNGGSDEVKKKIEQFTSDGANFLRTICAIDDVKTHYEWLPM